jgi:hypothetical protein
VRQRLRRDYPERRLAALAAAQGFPFVPLLEPLRAASSAAEVFLPDGHWNEEGIRIGARLVLETLRPAAVGAVEVRAE